MIIKIEDARICYDEILKKVRRIKGGRLLIFVGFDIDSICSLRLLIMLIRADSIKFEIIPVFNYENLEKKIEDYRKSYEKNKDIASIVMLNCGGTLDLTKHWFTDPINNILTLIIDSHRPISHNNIHHEYIVFIDDSKYNLENVPKEEELREVKEADSDDYDSDNEKNANNEENNYEDDFESSKNNNGKSDKNRDDKSNIIEEESKENEFLDEEQEFLFDEEAPNKDTNLIGNQSKKENKKDEMNIEEKEDAEKKKKRLIRKKHHLENLAESDQDGSKIEDIDLGEIKEKKSAEIDEKILKRNIKRKKKLKIANYYAGKYYGYPTSFIIYNIINQINRDDNHSLWLLIVAITDHYLQYHFSDEDYDNLYAYCLKEVLRINKNTNMSNRNFSNNFDESEENKDLSKLLKTLNKEVKTISQELDYKLFLYKHWNLFDSFIYSNYTVASLMTWKEEGKKEIQKILAYMGIPLDEAKQKYIYMKNEYKTVFKDKIIEISKRFDMKDLVFESFIYQFDQRTQLSACDFVYCLNAILEYPFNMSELHDELVCITNETIEDLETKNLTEDANGEFSNNSNSEGETGGANVNNLNGKSNQCGKRLLKIDHFWTTYEFLGLKASKLVKTALDLAIKFQISLVNNGTAVIDKKKITPSNNFRYAIINNDLSDDIKYFQNPLSLEKLSLFVMNLYHKSKFNKMFENKPFILALSHSTNNSYLVAGVISYDGSNDKNDFSMRFRLSSRKLSAKLIYNNFNDCIVEIFKNDFIAFLEDVCQN
jgi:cell division control protein 45